MLYIISQEYNVLGILQNKGESLSYYDDLHTENLETGAEFFDFTTLADHPTSEFIEIGNLIVFKNLEGDEVMFTIMNIEDSHGEKFERRVHCEQAGMQLINEFESPYKAPSQSYLPYYANKALSSTSWQLGKDESESNLTLSFEEYDSVLKRLQTIASEFKMELYFTIKMRGSSIVAKYVNFVKERGENTGKIFDYSKDISSIIRRTEGEEIITAVRAIGKTDEKGFTTNIKSEVYDDGNYYSPADSDLIYSRDAFERWGRQGGNLFGVYTYETTNQNTLFSKALSHLKTHSKPRMTYEVDVALLERLAGYEHEKVRIGDTVRITDFEFNPPLLLEARIIQLETSYTDPTKDKALLGEFRTLKSSISEQLRTIQSKLLQKEATWDEIGETILKQGTTPDNPVEGQLWLNTSETPRQVYIYESGQWKPTSVPQSVIDGLENELNTIQITVNGKETAVVKSATAPSTPTSGQLWLDISGTPNQLKVYLSGAWKPATPDNTYINNQIDTKIDKIQIGGENLLLNSETKNVNSNNNTTSPITKTLMTENNEQFYRIAPASGATNPILSLYEVMFPSEITDKSWSTKDVTFSFRFRSSKIGATISFKPTVYTATGTVLATAPASISYVTTGKWQTAYYVFSNFPADVHTDNSKIAVSFDPKINESMAGYTLDLRGYKIEFGNKVTDWSRAFGDLKTMLDTAITGVRTELTDLDTELTNFQTTVNGSFKDGIISEAEAKALKTHIQTIDNEKSEFDSRYSAIYLNSSLTGSTEKTNLDSAKTAYNTAHTNLKNSINTAITDGKATTAEVTAVETSFNSYRTALNTLIQRIEEAINKISSKKVDDAKAELNTSINNLSTSLTDFQTTVNGSFKDAVISEAEAKAIKSYQQQIDNEKAQLDSQYTTVYANTSLNSTTEKTNLASAKTSYDSSHSTLRSSITTAIADGKATSAEATAVDTNFTAYRTQLTLLNQRLQQALDKISSVRDGLIQVGGENLITNSAPDDLTGWEKNPVSTGTLEVIDEATAPLGRAMKLTFDATAVGVKKIPVAGLTNGKSYTWSVMMKANKSASITIGNEKGGTQVVALTTAWNRYTYTFTASTATNYAMIFYDNSNVMIEGDAIFIHSLKLEEGTRATSWSASSREIKGDINFIREDLDNIEQKITDDAIITTITNSTKYVEDLASKAGTDDIADMATGKQVDQLKTEVTDALDKKADSTTVDSAFEQISQIQQTAQDFQIKLQSSGGINLLKNSVGYAKFTSWSSLTPPTAITNISTLVNEEFTQFGSDSVFSLNGGSMAQTILVEPNNFYTLNFVVYKPSTGTLTVTLLDGDVAVNSKTFVDGTAYQYERHTITMTALSNTVTVQLSGTGQIGVMMLNIGDEPLQWQQAIGEIYNANIQFDINGITTKSTAYNGYTVISPEEFAGYAEVIKDDGTTEIQRIFTLNGATTEVKEIDVDTQISMGKLKVINISGTTNGWAFIKNQ